MYKVFSSYSNAGADPGFEKGGGTVALGARSQDVFGLLGDFSKNLGQKGVGVCHPAPPSGSAPDMSISTYTHLYIKLLPLLLLLEKN